MKSLNILSEKYTQVMGNVLNEMTTAGIPEDTAEPMSSMSEECWVRGKKVNIDSIELDEGKGNSAKAIKAHYVDGTSLTDEELDELNNPGTSTGVPNVKQQPGLVNGVPSAVVGEETEQITADAIEIGTKHEMEHTKDPLVAKKIAMDHLREDPKYYEKLAKIGLESPETLPAPVKPSTPTTPGTPTKPSRPHPLTPTKPGISPRPKAENTGDVNKFIGKRQHFFTK